MTTLQAADNFCSNIITKLPNICQIESVAKKLDYLNFFEMQHTFGHTAKLFCSIV